jgi:hypothetical protein
VVLDQWQNKNMEISDDHYNDWCIAMPCWQKFSFILSKVLDEWQKHHMVMCLETRLNTSLHLKSVYKDHVRPENPPDWKRWKHMVCKCVVPINNRVARGDFGRVGDPNDNQWGDSLVLHHLNMNKLTTSYIWSNQNAPI